ncbi:hypothetical protein ABIB45_002100 [Arthrobacter sp. UYCo732]
MGTLNGGWPLTAKIAFTTQKGNGLAAAAQAALNTIIGDGSYAETLDRWGLYSEAAQKSELNPAGLPKKQTQNQAILERRRFRRLGRVEGSTNAGWVGAVGAAQRRTPLELSRWGCMFVRPGAD